MDPQEGDVAEDGGGNFLVYRGGDWYPAQQDGRPLERIPRPDYGAAHYQLPNGDIVRQGPRGGQETVENFGGAGGGSGGSGLVSADQRGRYSIGANPLVRAEKNLAIEEADGNPLNRDWGAVALNAIDLDPRGDSSFRPFAPLANLIGGQDYQNAQQALSTYEASLMPIQSGASVTASEAARQIRADFPALGDSEETLRRKAANRRDRINAILSGIGRPPAFTDSEIANPTDLSTDQEEAALAGIGGAAGGDGDAPTTPPGGPPDGPVDISGMSAAELLQLTPGTAIRLPDGTVTRLTGTPSVGASGREVSPGVFAQETPEEAVAARGEMNPILRRVDGAVRGAADAMTFGFADEIAAAGDTLIGRGSYDQNLERQRALDKADAQAIPVSRGAGQLAGAVAAPGAMTAGSFVARAPNLASGAVRGAMTGAAAGGVYGAGAAEGDLASRGQGLMTGGATGAIIGGALPPLARATGAVVGALGGRALADTASDVMARFSGRPMTAEDRAVRTMARGAELGQMEARAAQYRAEGIDPTFADLGGSNVQSRTRVAATRQTPGREVAERFAAGRRSEVQDLTLGMGRRISPTEASPDQLDTALEGYQRAASAPEFAAARAAPPITLDDGTTQALWGPEGRTAMQSAARLYQSSSDPAERALAGELTQLASGEPNPQMSVGAADLIARYLQKAGGTDMNSRRIFGGLGTAVRDAARAQSPEYDTALSGYAQRARLGDATEIGERFVGNKGYVADFEQGIGEMRGRGAGRDIVPQGTVAPERVGGELQVARAASRAAFERAAGTPRGANQVLDAFADGPDQRRRAAALLGPEEARSFSEGAVLRRSLMTTANNVNPRAGSSSFMNFSDDDGLERAAGNLMKARPISAAMDLIRSRFTSDEQAETIVRLALDRGRTDEVLQILRTRFPDQEAQRIVEQLTPAIAGQSGGATAPRQPRMVGSPQ